MYEMIKEQLTASVPFAQHVGVTIDEVGPGTAVVTLPEAGQLLNHIQTQHAGALFTVGETASGAAVIGALAERAFSIRPIATGASIKYVKKAVGPIQARAQTSQTPEALAAQLDETRRAAFDVLVTLSDAAGNVVAEMTVGWLVSQR